MAYIENLIETVNMTHAGLGDLVAMLQIAVKAQKMLLIVSPSGCGKSTAMSLIAQNMSDVFMPDRLSIAGLAFMQDRLNSFRSVIVVDDIATTQTDYARKTTITTLSSLVYTHRIESMMMGIQYEVNDFFGSALVGIQPVLLRNLMLSEEWDASVQDKTLRYYHLRRPIKPSMGLPKVELKHGIGLDMVSDFEPDIEDINWQKLVTLGISQWSIARTTEHLIALLKAISALESRKKVIASDYALLVRLLKPMAIENVVVIKKRLESERYLDDNLLALLAEYYSYNGEYDLEQVAIDYKLSVSQCYRIMQKESGNWQQISKSPTIYRPNKKLLALLKRYELEV